MPSKKELVNNVVSQLIRSGVNGRIQITPEEKELFLLEHQNKITWAINNVPRFSSAVYAVIVKCLIKYEVEKVQAFCKALKFEFFNGAKDPAHILWKFLKRYKGHDTMLVYWKTVTAAKAYMEDKTIENLRVAKNEDIFTWEEGFKTPSEYRKKIKVLN